MIPTLIPFYRRLPIRPWTRYGHSPGFSPARERSNHFRFLSAQVSIDDEEASFGNYSVILPEEPFVWGVSHITPRTVQPHVKRPSYARTRTPVTGDGKPGTSSATTGSRRSQEEPYQGDSIIRLGTGEETKIRAAAKLARDVREFSGTLVRPGETTNSIDKAIHDFIVARGAYPSPLLYSGFPRSCCTSVNNVVTHGIPDDRPLDDGDIINIDVTVYLGGYHGDTSKTFLVGTNVDQQGRDLVAITQEALQAGIDACGPYHSFSSIGKAIYARLRGTPYSVCDAFSGHGIGKAFHQPPWICHTLNEEPEIMRPGHCFTIEPAIVQGSKPQVWIFPDGWTASTENCARSAQAEHMVLITETGAEVLTL